VAIIDAAATGFRYELGTLGADFVYEHFLECRSPLGRSDPWPVRHLQNLTSV